MGADNTGSVIGYGNVGGVVGKNEYGIEWSSNSDQVGSTGSAGGVVGSNEVEGTIVDAHNSGPVEGG